MFNTNYFNSYLAVYTLICNDTLNEDLLIRSAEADEKSSSFLLLEIKPIRTK